MLILEELDKLTTGLSPHYMLIYNIVRGLDTQNSFEFGAGLSTHVILSALFHTSGKHISCSRESRNTIENKSFFLILNNSSWTHYLDLSENMPKKIDKDLSFEFVLHDGSHSASTVEGDLNWIKRKIKYNGILVIHDTLHSYCGPEMRAGIKAGLSNFNYEKVTLPYGFGLTIICIKDNEHLGKVNPIMKKKESLHFTENI